MAWQVAGTRDRLYRVDTPDEVTSWVADEIESITDGWIPLASGRELDGSLRVTHGDVSSSAPPPDDAPPNGSPVVQAPRYAEDVRLGGWVALLALLAILTTFAVMAKP
jgi:hypothetical protein